MTKATRGGSHGGKHEDKDKEDQEKKQSSNGQWPTVPPDPDGGKHGKKDEK